MGVGPIQSMYSNHEIRIYQINKASCIHSGFSKELTLLQGVPCVPYSGQLSTCLPFQPISQEAHTYKTYILARFSRDKWVLFLFSFLPISHNAV